jgi:ABC-type transport system substrate-binding protein
MKGVAPGTGYLGEVVGAQAYEAGKAKHISGLVARGNTLTITLTHAEPDVLSQLAVPFFCAVPPGTPFEGVSSVPAAGPYYVSSYNPAQGAVLKPNPNYHGARPHALGEIDYRVNVGPADSVREVEAGTADLVTSVPAEQVASLNARYGPGSPAAHAGGQRFFVNPEMGLWFVSLNTSRSLFKHTNLRKAVNYALDRRAIAQLEGGPPGANGNKPTDQYFPPGVLGYRDTHIYPLTPNLARAKQLARGHGGNAVLYYLASPSLTRVAQLIQSELAPIGINVETKALSFTTFFGRVGTRGEPYDMALYGWNADYPDPSDFLNTLYAGSAIRAKNGNNTSFFDDPVYNRQLAAAARLSGPRRYLAYQALETDLARNAAPAAPLWNNSEQDFFSAHIGSGCKTYQPVYGVDLAALCLRG